MNTKQKLIAIDLDGTLLHSDNSISDYTQSVINHIRKLGHKIIITTGRPYRMSNDYYQQLNLDTPMINFNGSLIHIPETQWEHEHSVTIDKKYLLAILELKKEFHIDFLASEYRKHFYIETDNLNSINPALFGVEKMIPKMRLQKEKITENPNALLMQTFHKDKYQLATDIREHFNHNIEVASWGGPLNILEFSPKSINKAYGLKYLLNLYNMSNQDLIAFGDEHNDTQMLSLAGKGYAMKNASSILLPHADEQLPHTNDEDGVAKKLEDLFLA